EYVRANPDQVDAIRILFDRPRDWGTGALVELRQRLATTKHRFTEENLRKAHEAEDHKPLVDIISMVKHAADASAPLLTAEERGRCGHRQAHGRQGAFRWREALARPNPRPPGGKPHHRQGRFRRRACPLPRGRLGPGE